MGAPIRTASVQCGSNDVGDLVSRPTTDPGDHQGPSENTAFKIVFRPICPKEKNPSFLLELFVCMPFNFQDILKLFIEASICF